MEEGVFWENSLDDCLCLNRPNLSDGESDKTDDYLPQYTVISSIWSSSPRLVVVSSFLVNIRFLPHWSGSEWILTENSELNRISKKMFIPTQVHTTHKDK